MAKTKIEWCQYSINPVKGLCPMACDYCYARSMYKRFKWNPEIRYIEPGFTINEIQSIKKPSRIFVGSIMELFGNWIPDLWLKDTFKIVRQFPQHTFIFLTKQPQNLANWSPFPNNCWVGVSVTNREQFHNAHHWLPSIVAKVKFVSFEPLLDDVMQALYGQNLIQFKYINWLIIGQQTPVSKRTEPKIEWIKEIVSAADSAGIPIFLKENLKTIIPEQEPLFNRAPHVLRQEFPKGDD